MMTPSLASIRGQSGVAMVTVLFVAAALTAVTSMAAFVTVREFRAGSDDRKAAEALAYAEAGVDRMLLELRRGLLNWGEIRQAGCEQAPITLSGEVGVNGRYTAQLMAFDNPDIIPASPWSTANASARPCVQADGSARPTNPKPPNKLLFAIISTGTRPAARKVVRQVVAVSALQLPIGIYAKSVDANGSADINGLSMISEGDVTGREKLSFKNNDLYYKLSDFWPSLSSTTAVPAALHAQGSIHLKKSQGNRDLEHPPPLNCTANGVQGTLGQSQWDQSGLGSDITSTTACSGQGLPPPPTSLFTVEDRVRLSPKPELEDQDYLVLRESAKQDGMYCLIKDTSPRTYQCKRLGTDWTTFNGTVSQADVDYLFTRGTDDFVAYFEFENPAKAATNELGWNQASVWACPDRSVTLIVRHGGLGTASNNSINGAILVPEGTMTNRGTLTFNGTIIADKFDNSGNSSFTLSQCWIDNFPGPFLDISPTRWSELDR